MLQKNEGILGSELWDKESSEPESASLARTAKSWLNTIKPSFFTRSGRAPVKLHRTSYLDGLRGFAALLVYFGHHQVFAHDAIESAKVFESAYGYDGQYYFACLPFIRIFFSGGHLAVTTFFVISGYVLSNKPLSYIQSGEYVKLGDNLASALFRRWIRLYTPIILTTFIWLSTWHLLGVKNETKTPQGSYRDEIWNWYAEFKNFSFVFKTEGELWFTYNFHVWSIPLEFRGSIVIYTALLAFSRCTRNARLWCEAGLIFYFLYIVDGWFCAAFVSGMLLCDLDQLELVGRLPDFFNYIRPYKETASYALLVISLYLAGVPSFSLDVNDFHKSPGWSWLAWFKPQAVFNPKYFYLFWAASFLVVAVPRIAWLKAFMECRFCQYLGHISYGFYLVHGPILFTLGNHMYAACGMIRPKHGLDIPDWINLLPIPNVGPLGLELSFLIPQLITLPFTLWMAELTTKFFDEPVVKSTQWFYHKTLEPKT